MSAQFSSFSHNLQIWSNRMAVEVPSLEVQREAFKVLSRFTTSSRIMAIAVVADKLLESEISKREDRAKASIGLAISLGDLFYKNGIAGGKDIVTHLAEMIERERSLEHLKFGILLTAAMNRKAVVSCAADFIKVRNKIHHRPKPGRQIAMFIIGKSGAF